MLFFPYESVVVKVYGLNLINLSCAKRITILASARKHLKYSQGVMMRNLLQLSALAAATALFVSCQTVPYQGQAREVKRKPNEGGIIALTVDHRPEDRMKADEKMKSNCADTTVKITEEGEVSVGQKTTSNSSDSYRPSSQKKVGTLFGMPLVSGQAAGTDTSASATTMDIKEWQISYECLSAKKKVSR
jgi:hypothetical protein